MQALLKDIPQSNTQVSEILLTALGQTFTQWMGNASLHVDVEANERVELFDNFEYNCLTYICGLQFVSEIKTA